MTSTPASPTSHLLSGQTPKTPNPITTITSTSTPHTSSQDVNQSVQSSFQTGGAAITAGSTIGSQQMPFPPAAAFTFLPDLYTLISRLRLLEGTAYYKSSNLFGVDNGTNSRPPTASPLLHRSEPTSANAGVANSGTSTSIHGTAFSEKKVKEEDNDAAGADKAIRNASHDHSSAATVSIEHSGIKGESDVGDVGGTAATAAAARGQERRGPLEIKDIPSHVYEIKQRIQIARDIVAGLPDIQRSPQDQEVEIDTLNARIHGLRKRLGELAQLAATASVTSDKVPATTRDEASHPHGDSHIDVRKEEEVIRQEEDHDIVMKGIEGGDAD